jgi:ABC-type multidrug transport system ATPase subunit
VLPADGGTLRHDDRVVPPGARSSVLFYMPDAIAPWPSQTVRWALAFTAGFFGESDWSQAAARPEPDCEPDWRQAANRLQPDHGQALDLEPLLDAPIGTLSKGQRKRVLLAIGLRTPQPVLLADEPFDGLDLRQTREVGRALRSYAARGRTLFLSIHQISDAARICDRFVLLSAGRVCGEGTLDELSSLAAARGATPSTDLEDIFLVLT